jgi:glycosidase
MHGIIAIGAMGIGVQPREVSFSFLAPEGAATVAVVGQFNNWDRAAHPLRRTRGDKWEGTAHVAPGVYQYLFVIDGKQWVRDPSAPTASDANGNTNSLLVVQPQDYDDQPAERGDGSVTASGLRHDPGMGDRLRRSQRSVLLRLRTRKGDASKVVARIGKVSSPLRLARSDELYDYWQGVAEPPPGRCRYRFAVDGRTVAAPGGQSYEWDWEREPTLATPGWLRGAVVYQVFPDRFMNGEPANDPAGALPWGSPPTADSWMGGDLPGLAARLGHVRDLGANVLYLNPVFETDSNHGYTTRDYYRVDDRFGGAEGFGRLLQECRTHGVRLLLDGVFNHSGVRFGPFVDVRKRGKASPYASWFHLLSDGPVEVREGQQTYATFAGVWQMPKLATHQPVVQEFVAGVGAHWIRAGASGWRLDVADEVAPHCWRVFRQAVKAADPEAYIVGEVWGDAGRWLQGDMFDGVMNYRWRQAVLDLCTGRAAPSEFVGAMETLTEDYPEGAEHSLMNLLGSHDTERLRRTVPDESLRRLAVVLQMTWPGVPSVYYGDEVGLDGGRDPDDRRCMPWDQSAWSLPTLAHYKALIGLRRAEAALHAGSLGELRGDDRTGVLSFVREHQGRAVWVALGFGSRPASAAVPAGPARLLLSSEGARLAGGKLRLPAGGFGIVRLGKG